MAVDKAWKNFARDKRSSLFDWVAVTKKNSFMTTAPVVNFIKHFTQVTYGPSKISCNIINCRHAPMQRSENALAYFAMVVSYTCKMFMKLSPEHGVEWSISGNSVAKPVHRLNVFFTVAWKQMDRISIIITHADWLTECGILRVRACFML